MARSGRAVPSIEFDNLPREISRHLTRRIRERKIQFWELERLRQWANSGPQAPDGDWWKDFGSFKLCGRGAYPRTVLTGAMRPFGEEIE